MKMSLVRKCYDNVTVVIVGLKNLEKYFSNSSNSKVNTYN